MAFAQTRIHALSADELFTDENSLKTPASPAWLSGAFDVSMSPSHHSACIWVTVIVGYP